MKNFLKLFFALFSVVIFAQRPMTADESATFIRNFTAGSKSIKTLQTDFTQTKKSAMLDKPAVSTGKMAYQNPSLLSWKYITPKPTTMISRDGKLFVTSKGKTTEVGAKNRAFEKISRLMIGSANGALFADPDFRVAYFKNGGTNIVRFSPAAKDLKKFIRQMELHFPEGKYTVSQVKLLDSSGDETAIQFRNTKINEALPRGSFN